jgi:hypothetical protein
MTHRRFTEWLPLYLYDELTPEERTSLETHLHTCAACSKELQSLKQLHITLQQAGSFAPEESQLEVARSGLRSSLRNGRATPSTMRRIIGWIEEAIQPQWRIALGGVMTLAIGVLIGRAIIPGAPVQGPATTASVEPAMSNGEQHIMNIRFINSDPSRGEIEFTFDAITPVHMKGNINDDRVQKVLAHALVNDQNPGNRLRTVAAFAAQVERQTIPDREVKAALLSALVADRNPGVRREAIRTLRSFPFDDQIKQGFLQVLMHDPNPAMRIAAINGLDSARVQGQAAGNELLDALKQRIQTDENTYVRIRAKAVLEEVRNQ